MLEYYMNLLGYKNVPNFLIKYLNVPSLVRLKGIGYFCGMDYASKNIYDFSEIITRYDHSLTVALLTYKLTKNKKMTLAALFHDIATPCFSHVIDYMNKDYEKQESTEEYTEKILLNDKHLKYLFQNDNISIDDIVSFKKYSIVDNERPKLCADRLDGVILNGIGWTKNITEEDIENVLSNIKIFINEKNEEEIGFTCKKVAEKIISISKSVDVECHSKEDNYMMEYLANITAYSINNKYIKYEDLYYNTEKEIFKKLLSINDEKLHGMLNLFFTIEKKDIEDIEISNIKVRSLNPIVNSKRLF